jgi:hypothetical protein
MALLACSISIVLEKICTKKVRKRDGTRMDRARIRARVLLVSLMKPL